MLSPSFDITALRAVPLFSPLSDEELELLRTALSVRTLSLGDVAVVEGTPADELFILLSGEVKVVKNHRRDDERVIAVLGPVEAFGEMSILSGEPRWATVIATEPSRFLTLSKDALESVLLKQPQVALTLLRDAFARLRKLQDQLR
jgi:CRP-like cAMP-binding protein